MDDKSDEKVVYSARNAGHTKSIAGQLSKIAKAGDVIGLVGDLGAGKTTFTQGFAKGLGVPDGVYVNSPTFTIINEYPTHPKIYHLDFYRLADADELIETGYDDLLNDSAICIIEWFDQIPEAWPEEFLRIEIREDKSGRILELGLRGASWLERLEMLKNIK